MAVDWSELPPELSYTVATKIKALTDYIRFRAVCLSWRTATPATPRHLPPQVPWLMLPPSQSQPQASRRGFFCLSANKFHFLGEAAASRRRRRCGSSHGWLVLLDESSHIFLLNPLTRSQVKLPSLSTFPNVTDFNFYNIGREYTIRGVDGEVYTCSLKEMRDSFIKKVILSSSPNELNYVAVAILNDTGHVAYCKKGDDRWMFMEDGLGYWEDVIYHDGLVYAVNKFGGIAVCDVSGTSPRVWYIDPLNKIGGDMQYLVSCEGELLLVTRYLDLNFDVVLEIEYKTTAFRVCRLDLGGPKWETLASLDDRVLFVGENSSLALSGSDCLGCKGNCIYFTDDYSEWNYDGFKGDLDLGVYNLEDGGIEALPCCPHNAYSGRRWPPPIWVTPNPC
ncbi:hypothetical protein RJ640_020773 [Escallonia rubra]|uniref:KIB1-4 beta-propeller domain-containing protein n=1 Tax=Escallonia rubra TaxID=112253 RepID=A0AA88RS84_9ASTE|nr:hypothetical protein RJ640_020773 [Escallonia rubra]